MYENSEYEQSFSQKKPANHGSEESLNNCHFSDLPKGHPPKKNNFGPYRIFKSVFFRISVESWKSRDLHFWGRCLENTKPKKTPCFFPGTKMLLLDVFGWSDRWAQRDVIESILKKCDTNRQSMHKLTLRDISNIYIYTYKFPTHFFIWYFSMVNVGKCSMY